MGEYDLPMDENCISCGRDAAPGTPLYAASKRALDTASGVEGRLTGVAATHPRDGRIRR